MSCRVFSVVGTFKVCSLRITQEQDTVLSAIIAKLPIRSPERIYLSTGSVCPRPAAPHFLPTPVPGTALYSLFLSVMSLDSTVQLWDKFDSSINVYIRKYIFSLYPYVHHFGKLYF